MPCGMPFRGLPKPGDDSEGLAVSVTERAIEDLLVGCRDYR